MKALFQEMIEIQRIQMLVLSFEQKTSYWEWFRFSHFYMTVSFVTSERKLLADLNVAIENNTNANIFHVYLVLVFILAFHV